MRRMLIALTLAASALLTTPAFAQDTTPPANDGQVSIDPAQREKITLLLSGYHYFPTREKLEAESPNAPAILIAIAEDGAHLPSLRIQAIRALGLFSDDATAATWFERRLHEARLPEDLLRHALTASLRGFGERALPWVEPYLGHPDEQMRLSAVNAIGKLAGAPGRLVLEQRREMELDQRVIQDMDRFIRPGQP